MIEEKQRTTVDESHQPTRGKRRRGRQREKPREAEREGVKEIDKEGWERDRVKGT